MTKYLCALCFIKSLEFINNNKTKTNLEIQILTQNKNANNQNHIIYC